MIRSLPFARPESRPSPALTACEHRSVAPDGRIVCKKITWGENRVSSGMCRACPFQAVDCAHLRFSLRHLSPTPLVVRFNGRTEVWNDDPPTLQFEQAACACQVMPIASPQACAGCPLRQPLAEAAAPAAEEAPAARRAAASRNGKVVPFVAPEREAVAAAS